MTSERNNVLLLLICSLIYSGLKAYALDYDYSYTPECLATPLKPQYGGGIIMNPELNDGLIGWSTFGDAKIEKRVSSDDGNKFIVALNRQGMNDSFSQKFMLEKEKFYIVSAWLQVSYANAEVAAVIKTSLNFEHTAWTTARSGCWSMLKGGFVSSASGPAELLFMSTNASVEIWADSISLQPFSQEEWKSHQEQSIEKIRKTKVKIQVVDSLGQPLTNATVSIKQQNQAFPLGCAISPQILNHTAYQNWFTSRFKLTVFENEMKWYINEPSPGKEDYSLADAMLQFTKKNNIIVRGHNVVWDNPKLLPSWVTTLSADELSAAIDKRINSIMKRYAGQLIHWDVVNENMHYSFLEDKLGRNASAAIYQKAYQIDSKALPFLNEYNTIEQAHSRLASPAKYVGKIKETRSLGYNGPLGLGLQGHFRVPNIPYMRTATDIVATAKLPIWLTELDVSNNSRSDPNQVAVYLEQVLREAHAHPAINGIIIWSPWQPQGCYKMCLTDNKFKNLPAGDVVDKILKEWSHQGLSDSRLVNGDFEMSLFHGDYEVKVSHPAMANPLSHRFEVPSVIASKGTLYVKVSA